jgi:hypothetical protein
MKQPCPVLLLRVAGALQYKTIEDVFHPFHRWRNSYHVVAINIAILVDLVVSQKW